MWLLSKRKRLHNFTQSDLIEAVPPSRQHSQASNCIAFTTHSSRCTSLRDLIKASPLVKECRKKNSPAPGIQIHDLLFVRSVLYRFATNVVPKIGSTQRKQPLLHALASPVPFHLHSESNVGQSPEASITCFYFGKTIFASKITPVPQQMLHYHPSHSVSLSCKSDNGTFLVGGGIAQRMHSRLSPQQPWVRFSSFPINFLSEKLIRCCRDLLTALLRGKWTEAS